MQRLPLETSTLSRPTLWPARTASAWRCSIFPAHPASHRPSVESSMPSSPSKESPRLFVPQPKPLPRLHTKRTAASHGPPVPVVYTPPVGILGLRDNATFPYRSQLR